MIFKAIRKVNKSKSLAHMNDSMENWAVEDEDIQALANKE